MNKIPKPQSYDWTKHTKPEKKSNLKNSRTVPDMNYTIRQIMDKFTTGQPINNMVSYNEYDGDYLNHHSEKPDFDGFMPHPKTLDLVDRQQMAEQAKQELKRIGERKSKFDKEQQDKRDKDKQTITDLTNKIQILENPAGGKSKE